MKVHTMLVLGQRNIESSNIIGQRNLGAKPGNEVLADFLTSIKERRAN